MNRRKQILFDVKHAFSKIDSSQKMVGIFKKIKSKFIDDSKIVNEDKAVEEPRDDYPAQSFTPQSSFNKNLTLDEPKDDNLVNDEHKALKEVREKYISQNFVPKIPLNEMFSEEEKEIIIEYGVWFNALTNDFPTYTEDQRHFSEVAKNKDYENATTEYEKAWVKYLIRLDVLTSNDGNPITDYSNYKEARERRVKCY
jgi:uncharacterized protein YifE (UPF0438 family)